MQWLLWVIGIPVLIGFPVNDVNSDEKFFFPESQDCEYTNIAPPNPPKPRSPSSLQLSISRVCVAHPPPTYPQHAPPLPLQDGSVPTTSSDKGSSTTPQRLPQWKNTTDNMEGMMTFLLVTVAFLLSRFLDSCYSIYTTPSFVKLGRVSSNDKGAIPGYHSLEHH